MNISRTHMQEGKMYRIAGTLFPKYEFKVDGRVYVAYKEGGAWGMYPADFTDEEWNQYAGKYFNKPSEWRNFVKGAVQS